MSPSPPLWVRRAFYLHNWHTILTHLVPTPKPETKLGPPLLIRLECDDPIDEQDGGVPSSIPEGPLSLTEHLSPKAQTLLKIAGYSAEGEGTTITEANFRAALAADACGAQVFAQGMKMFLTVRWCVWRGNIWVVDIFDLCFSANIKLTKYQPKQPQKHTCRTCAPWKRFFPIICLTSTRAKSKERVTHARFV